MPTSNISNTILGPTGDPVPNAVVQAKLMPHAGFRIDTFTEVARIKKTTTNASGFWQLELEEQANITPEHTWYEVTEFVPDVQGGKRVWTISVGATAQNLLASLVTPAETMPSVVPAGDSYITQASGDARYQQVGSLSSSTPSQIDAGDTGQAGVSTSASRADHQHAAPAGGTPVAISLSGTNSASATTEFARIQHVHAYNPPACRVFNSAVISIAHNVLTTVTYNSERYDTDSMHSTSINTERITFNTAGVYVVSFNGEMAAGTYTRVRPHLRLNGTTHIAVADFFENTGSSIEMTLTAMYKFAANDYVEILIGQVNGASAARNLLASGNYSPEFSATWVGVG